MVDYTLTAAVLSVLFMVGVFLYAFKLPLRRRSPWQAKVLLRKELDIPPQYLKLSVDYWAPVRMKGYTAFITGLFILVPLWIPGIFFTDPVTHIPDPRVFYLGVLGACVVAVLDLINLKAIDYFKDVEAAPFDFGKFWWTIRDGFEVEFHSVIGKIEKLSDSLAEEIKSVLDGTLTDYIKTVQAVAKAGGATEGAANSFENFARAAFKKLNVFYRQLPGNTGIQDSFVLSPANEPSELLDPLPDAVIWKKYTRHHTATKYKEAIVGEYRFKDPLGKKDQVQVAPICMGAGTPFEVKNFMRAALMPPTVNAQDIANTKILANGRMIGSEAIQQLAVYKSDESTRRQFEPEHGELVMNTVGTVLDMFRRARKPGELPGAPKRWDTQRIAGLVIVLGGAAILIAAAVKYLIF